MKTGLGFRLSQQPFDHHNDDGPGNDSGENSESDIFHMSILSLG